jgi:hypothetical protein
MIKQKYSDSIEIKMDTLKTDIPSLLVDSLKFLGYKDINVYGNMIEFKSDKDDDLLRPYQSSFGNGILDFINKDNALYLTITKDVSNVKRYSYYIVDGLIILITTILLFGYKHYRDEFTWIISFGYIVSFFLGLYGDKSYYKYKLKDFLKRINDYSIKNNASHQHSV